MQMSRTSFARRPAFDLALRVDRALAAPARLLVAAYRYLISPLLAPSCRFEPSCSRFAEESLDRFGLLRGSWKAFGRLLRCHPWSPGGYDPVPAGDENPCHRTKT